MIKSRQIVRGVLAALILLLSAGALAAQQAYRTPPQVVVDMLDAPPPPATLVSPDRAWLLLADRAAMPTITDLSQPMLRLAGDRINPATNGPFRAVSYTGLRLKQIADGAERAIQTPPGAKIGYPTWSPDGGQIAFTVTAANGIAQWVASVATGQAQALTDAVLNATAGAPCDWMPDATELLCQFIPGGRGVAPATSRVPAGPHVQTAEGRSTGAPTYQDLLQNPDDERSFDYYYTARLGRVNVATRAVAWLGEPGIYDRVDASPNGQFLLVERVQRPYSYTIPSNLFPHTLQVWDRDGRLVRRIADVPLGERIPQRGVRTGPRSLQWRAGRPSQLVWAEALDGGDPRRQVPQRDRVVALTLPAGDTAEVTRTEYRYGGVQWGERDGLALLTEMDRPSRRTRTWILNVDQAGVAPRKLFDRNTEDAYADRGRPMMRPTPTGESILLQSADGRFLYLSGPGSSVQGDHPFVDKLDLRTLQTQRLFQAQDPYYESVLAVLDPAASRILTSRESQTEPANVFVRDLVRRTPPRALTDVRDPAPALRGLSKQLVTARRADGVQLSGTLYLPPGYQPGTRLPVVMWVYPAEFGSADAAGQVRGSANRFTRVGGASHLFLLTQGYAVLDNPSLPVVGGDTANNSYVPQVVAGAQAWIDRMVEMGVGDRNRMGVGGHSYGAFTTANLLAHSDLFRTGIARSGAYNRTLTPFGFQAEERNFWQAREVYNRLSPFFYADSINEPILMIHGEADDNTGTFPIQSDRMFAALKGLGARAELVTYPYEAHGYAARETLLDCVARMIDWYDRYVKNASN